MAAAIDYEAVELALYNHGWTPAPTYQIGPDGMRAWHRDSETLCIKFGGSPLRVTKACYIRPRRPGETSDLTDDFNPAWAPPMYILDLPRKGTTAAVMEYVTAPKGGT